MRPFRLVLLLCIAVPLVLWEVRSSAANGGGGAAVQSIEVTAEQVTVHLSAAAAYTQAALPKDPLHGRADRCYVDVSGVLGQQVERVYAGDSQHVQQVRVAQFQPQTVRVVLDLLSAQPCQVRQAANPDRLQIIVGRSTWQDNMTGAHFTPAELPTPTIQPEPAAEPQVDHAARPEPATEPPAHQVARPEPAAEPPVDQVALPEPAAELQASGALEYLDLRTPFSSETRPAQAISIFDQQTPEGARSQLSLLGQQPSEGITAQSSLLGQQSPEGTAPQSSLFNRQAIDETALQLAPRGLYLLQGEGQDAGSSAAPRLEW